MREIEVKTGCRQMNARPVRMEDTVDEKQNIRLTREMNKKR